jgi:RNA polymerase sigma-70 factor (ECF subfamily)
MTPSTPCTNADELVLLEHMYRTQARFIARHLRRWGVRPADVEDAMQDVFIVLLRRHAELIDPTHWRAWLYGVARHTSRAYRRAAMKRGAAEHAAQECERQLAPADDEARTLVVDELKAHVSLALATLDDRKREVLILNHVEAMTSAQIARQIGVSPHTVASRLRAGRRALRRALQRAALTTSRD